ISPARTLRRPGAFCSGPVIPIVIVELYQSNSGKIPQDAQSEGNTNAGFRGTAGHSVAPSGGAPHIYRTSARLMSIKPNSGENPVLAQSRPGAWRRLRSADVLASGSVSAFRDEAKRAS